jgi:uncharacterized protein involved in exopolysaccharide biosynthesis
MSLADELQKLEQLRSSGALSEDEFKQAKAKLISTPGTPPPVAPTPAPASDSSDALGIILGLIVATLLLFIIFALAHHHYWHRGPYY